MQTGDGTLTAVTGHAPAIAYRFASVGGPATAPRAFADHRIIAEHRAEEVFVPASTLKLAVLAAVARSLESGALVLQQTVPAASTWPSEHDGAPFGFPDQEEDSDWPADGEPLAVAELCERMVVVSSNEATNMLFDLVGAEAVRQVFAEAGCTNSALGRKYGDLAAARHQGRASWCTPGDLAVLMSAVVSGRLASPEWTSFMVQLLARQQDAVIGGAVADACGPDTPWGSKSGWIDGIRHDVAYIGPSSATGGQRLVLAVCTRGFADHPSAVAAIRGLAHGLLSTVPSSYEVRSS